VEPAVYTAIVVATLVSVARTTWVVLGFVRTLARPSSSVDITWDWGIALVAPEVILPAAAAVWLYVGGGAEPPYPPPRELSVLLGAGLALSGLGLTIWSWVSLPSVSTGHYLLEDQPLVTHGAYGFVRHPIYSGAFLIWFGLAAAYASLSVFILTVAYVIPSYVFNIRNEERMMLARYGEEYQAYQRRVGAFLPRAGHP
jgi:protein-S-isoprenylcysteine O-methyltransferase Ste14